MPGILDFLNTPDAQLGMGLLAAGGPTTDPNQTGIGQRIAGAVNSVQAQQQNAIKTKLMAAQQQEAMQNAQLQQFQLKRLQDWQSMVMGDGAGQSPTGSSPAATAQAGGVMPSGADSMGGGSPAPGGMPSGAAPQSEYPQAQQTPQIPQSAQSNGRSFQFAIPGLGDQQSRVLAASMPPADYLKMYAGAAVPQTEIGKLLVQANIDPKSPLGLQMTQQSIAKANHIQAQALRAGAPYIDSSGQLHGTPAAAQPGYINIPNPDGTWSQVPEQGGLEAVSKSEQARTEGKAEGTNTVVYDPNSKPTFSTGGQDLRRARGQPPTPYGASSAPATPAPAYAAAFNGLPPAQGGMSSSFQGAPEQVLPLIAGMKDPQERANAYDAYSRQMTGGGTTQGAAAASGGATPVLPPGVVTGANLSQDELSAKYKDLAASNSSANTVISRLQNIKLLAPGAITGAESGRRDFMNGLLSLINVKGAEDSKTASDLVDKNSAQIVSALRMGQGSAGTDALQTLLGAGNPNRHMTIEAMQDATDQLIASQRLIQAKSSFLTPHALDRNPAAYGEKEQSFDQVADPRIWQWQGIQDPIAKKAFASQLIKSDPSIPGKIQALEKLGAIK